MDERRRKGLEQIIAEAIGGRQRIVGSRNCSGGCIHRAEILTLSDGLELFVKSNRNARDMFAQEASGLSALSQTNTIRVPSVIAAGTLEEGESCLIMEAISPAAQIDDFWIYFGRQFARLHRGATSASFGWISDNYIGSNLQPNVASFHWSEFWGEQRLGYQFRLARQLGRGSAELFRLGNRLIERLDTLIEQPEDPASLLHGDLWSGNYLIDEKGLPVLIDPAVYHGRREADLAMPLLFGGFPAAFFDGYQEVWPLEDGWRDRVEIYQLYHLLNHLNLFGSGYLESCLDIVRRLA